VHRRRPGPGRGARAGHALSGPVVVHTEADLRDAVGRELGPGPWVHVGLDRVRGFRAATTPGGGTDGPSDLAPAELVLSLTSSLAADLYDLRLGTARLNYGLESARFPEPVHPGSRVRLRCTFGAPASRPGALLVPIDLVVDSEGAARPACAARKLSLVLLA